MTITTASNPCWTLVNPEGREYEPEGVAHYPTRQATIDERNRHVKGGEWLAPLHGYEPRQLDAPCVHATCDACGYAYDEDDYLMHFDSAEDARNMAIDAQWPVDGDGIWCSAECKTDASKALAVASCGPARSAE